MQLQIDSQHADLNHPQKQAIDKKIRKIDRLCKLFKMELVRMHLGISVNKPPKGYGIRLDLSVPHEQFNVHTNNPKFSLAIGKAFSKISAQLRKYKTKLRVVRRT